MPVLRERCLRILDAALCELGVDTSMPEPYVATRAPIVDTGQATTVAGTLIPVKPYEPPHWRGVPAAIEVALRALEAGSEQIRSVPPVPVLTVEAWQRAMAQLGVRLAEMRKATAEVSKIMGLGSARERILHYFLTRVGEVIQGDELAGVSGIGEWARRVRELRVEHGWPIETGVQRVGLRPDEYILTHDEQDQELANDWRLAKEIRGRKTSGKDRLLEYLKAICPRPADQDQLSDVGKIKSWQRRMRELDEEGWEIRSNVDEPELAPGTYRLATLDMRPPRARQAIKLRYEILERDTFTCQDCGRKRGEPGVRLQVHHILPVASGGTNDPDNLITLCDADHAGRHALLGHQHSVDELLNPGAEPQTVVR